LAWAASSGGAASQALQRITGRGDRLPHQALEGLLSLDLGNHRCTTSWVPWSTPTKNAASFPATKIALPSTPRNPLQRTGGRWGLISGIAAAVKHQRPAVRVVGVEPEGADMR